MNAEKSKETRISCRCGVQSCFRAFYYFYTYTFFSLSSFLVHILFFSFVHTYIYTILCLWFCYWFWLISVIPRTTNFRQRIFQRLATPKRVHCCTFHGINLFSYYIYVYCYCQFSLVLEPHTVQISPESEDSKQKFWGTLRSIATVGIVTTIE